MPGIGGPLTLPDDFWDAPEVTSRLADRDVAGLLGLVYRRGVSQQLIAAAVSLQQGRISEILHDKRDVTSYSVIERIAAGLSMPDDARTRLGLAPLGDHTAATARTGRGRAYRDQAEAAADIRSDCLAAARVDILAVRGLGLIGLKDSLLRPVLVNRAEPVDLRVVLADPDSLAVRRRATEIGEDPHTMSEGTRLCLRQLADLAGCTVQTRLTSVPPVWRLIRADDVLYVSAFVATRQGHDSPVQRLHRFVDEPLFAGFDRTFTDTFDHARPA